MLQLIPSQIVPVLPKTKQSGLPVWFHLYGNKIRVKGHHYAESTLFLGSKRVDVSICPSHVEGYWIVEYEIRHLDGGMTKKAVSMHTQNLKTAFGLSDICDGTGQSILQEHGGDVASEGEYIRFGNFLNIPGPGTGEDGNLNLSIYLSESIKDMLELIID